MIPDFEAAEIGGRNDKKERTWRNLSALKLPTTDLNSRASPSSIALAKFWLGLEIR